MNFNFYKPNFFLINFALLYPIGKLPFAQGTFASLFTIIFSYYCLIYFGKIYFLLCFFNLLLLSFISIRLHVKSFNKKDPPEIVADELIGQMTSLSAILFLDIEVNFYYLLVSFITFRFFDISKIGLKSIEKLPKEWGILLDDIFAGIYSLFLQIILWKYIF